MKKPEKIVVVDVGNGKTNYRAGNGVKGEFSSLVTRYRPSEFQGIVGYTPFKITEGNFLVGDDARQIGVASRSTDTSYYSSVEYKVCLLYALSLIGIKNPIIVVGLPTEWFSKFRDDFKNDVNRWLREEGYNPEHIYVYPQHAGPFFDPSLRDQHGSVVEPLVLRKGDVGIIDIGQGTLDLGEFKNGKPTKRVFGEAYGISDIHKEVHTLLSDPTKKSTPRRVSSILPKGFQLDRRHDENSIDVWFRDGFIPYEAKQIDIWELSKSIRSAYADKYIARGISKLWGNTKFFTAVIIAGGGSELIGDDILKEHIGCPIFRPKEPNMSIVNGFFEMTRLRIKSRAG